MHRRTVCVLSLACLVGACMPMFGGHEFAPLDKASQAAVTAEVDRKVADEMAEDATKPSDASAAPADKAATPETTDAVPPATANSAPATTAAETPAVVADEAEISEAELVGESEADPDVIAVPKPPADDGREHDFVNVYSARPDAPVESIANLPGVDWNNDMILVSRGPDGGPGSLFDDGIHPFAHLVPGMPLGVVEAANGLLLAHAEVHVSCIKPGLLNLVRSAERRFGKRAVITSGYRSPPHNRRVHGAEHSQHLYCNALDLYMPGVERDTLARYFYDQPARGGLGLYCHTKSIHIDTGRRREWRWSCRRPG